MAQINAGEACGKCHGSVAFSAATCERCHLAMSMPADRVTPEFIGDIRFVIDSTETGRSTPPALFPHWSHRIRYRCSACHPAIFEDDEGDTRPTMSAMSDGESCGVCHNDQLSFGLIQCTRCHQSEPSEAPTSEG